MNINAAVPTPTAALVFVGSKIGTAAVKAVCTTAVAGRLTPEVLGEALVSSSSVRSHVQAELLQFVAVRVSVHSPKRLAWLASLLAELVAKGGGGGGADAVRLLGRRAVMYHVTSFGLRGTVASALAALAVQAGMATCQLVSSNVRPLLSPRGVQRRLVRSRNRQRRLRELRAASREEERAAMEQKLSAETAAAQRESWARASDGMSLAQYRYSLATALLSGVGTVVGSGAGAAVGTCVLPGFGTVIGSILFSFSGGYLPSYLRDNRGPDDRRRLQVEALKAFEPLAMREREAGFVEMLSMAAAGGKELHMTDLLEEDALASEDSVVVFRMCAQTSDQEVAGGDGKDVGGEQQVAAPANTVKTSLFSLGDWTPAFLQATRSLPSSASAGGASGDQAMEGEVSPAVTSATSWAEIDPAECAEAAPSEELIPHTKPPCVAGDMLTVLGGKMEVLPAGLDWAGLDACIDGFGEDELVLVFHVNKDADVSGAAPPAPSEAAAAAAAAS